MRYKSKLTTLRVMIAGAVTVALLTGCSTGQGAIPQFVTPNIPQIPPDVAACEKEPASDPRNGSPRRLTAGEVEKLWKTDRRSLQYVNDCFRRIVCQYHDVRKEIGRVEDEPVCVPTEDELRKSVPNIRKHQKRLE